MEAERTALTLPELLVRVVARGGLLFLIGTLFVIVPVSFSSAQYLTFPPPGFSLQWYRQFFGSPYWLDSIWISVQVAVISSILTMVLGVLASFPLVRSEFRGKMVVYAVILSPMIVPLIITAIAVYFLLVELNMSGTVIAMAIGHAVVVLPIVVVIVSATLQGFDIRLERAAISLGASPLKAFYKVTLPIIAPGILSGGIFAFLTSFDELMIPLFLGGPDTQTLAVRIWNSVVLEIEPTIAAVSTFLIGLALLVLTLTSLLLRWSWRSIAAGKARAG